MMKAMMLEFPAPISADPLRLVKLPPPAPGPGEILLEVNCCGVCHTDLHIVEGELPLQHLPLIPGHQVVGTVKELGRGVNRFQPGERVGLSWLNQACGQCRFCRGNQENLCDRVQFTGFHRDGGYGEFVTAPAAFAYPLPPSLADITVAPLLGGGIMAYRALKLSNIQPGGRLGLYGFGSSAHIAIQLARYRGCEVYVFTRSPGHQELARQLGAVWVGRSQDNPPARLDSAIIFAPAGNLVPEALRVLAKGGTLVMGATYLSAIPTLDYEKHLYHEKTICSVIAGIRQDGEELLRLAAQIPLVPHVQVFKLEEVNQALKLLKAGKINGSAVLAVNLKAK
jgi:alcohol dehydrogenase, propanol-preferring